MKMVLMMMMVIMIVMMMQAPLPVGNQEVIIRGCPCDVLCFQCPDDIICRISFVYMAYG